MHSESTPHACVGAHGRARVRVGAWAWAHGRVSAWACVGGTQFLLISTRKTGILLLNLFLCYARV